MVYILKSWVNFAGRKHVSLQRFCFGWFLIQLCEVGQEESDDECSYFCLCLSRVGHCQCFCVILGGLVKVESHFAPNDCLGWSWLTVIVAAAVICFLRFKCKAFVDECLDLAILFDFFHTFDHYSIGKEAIIYEYKHLI